MAETVCTVIVTYNRRALLKRCLEAVLAQTRPPEAVLVVNNASSDGTADMLAEEFPQVQALHLPENTGGAGGFHHGMAWAAAQGYDWISVMDDDGLPALDCFEQLLACPDKSFQVRGALVLDEADNLQLAFTLYVKHKPLTTVADVAVCANNGVICNYINPFNGIFIANSVIQAIGLPEKRFFFWGDEYEYFLRMKQAGIPLGVVVAARFYHPRNRMQADTVRLIVKRFPVYYADNPLKDYLIVRNQAYIVKKYRGWPGWAVHVARYLVFYWRLSGFKRLKQVFTASLHGARADFSHHKEFLA